ncbi:hypothetical protein TTHERM_000247059 (macronuclear) [Tetrahymena thermophila SB210]|uniref:Uncharacterized protein n=1 Tax=Tetrahymena thermophila (strain SB210) TaxID=312017 RepID=W7XDW7_TETTS|nr:hypothetical protein TTHERM_000247059 [Tetrahymena thermophila SB210]EWS72086.1 hypothetical protein TTHERM_000247059 [Tetrahymena thermophila SB210]|eukprot:XP_012655397.1 hypothetical protein TTHERM_000247059 [Tetrahymena thermophila SB210]
MIIDLSYIDHIQYIYSQLECCFIQNQIIYENIFFQLILNLSFFQCQRVKTLFHFDQVEGTHKFESLPYLYFFNNTMKTQYQKKDQKTVQIINKTYSYTKLDKIHELINKIFIQMQLK